MHFTDFVPKYLDRLLVDLQTEAPFKYEWEQKKLAGKRILALRADMPVQEQLFYLVRAVASRHPCYRNYTKAVDQGARPDLFRESALDTVVINLLDNDPEIVVNALVRIGNGITKWDGNARAAAASGYIVRHNH